jgi:hypothetical protein
MQPPPPMGVFNRDCLERNISIEDRTRYCYGQKVSVLDYFSRVQRVCRQWKTITLDMECLEASEREIRISLSRHRTQSYGWFSSSPTLSEQLFSTFFVDLPSGRLIFWSPLFSTEIVFYVFKFPSSTCIRLRNILRLELISLGYGLDGRGAGLRVPVGARFFSYPRRPDGFWNPPSLLSNGYRGHFFSWSKAAWAWSWPLTSN